MQNVKIRLESEASRREGGRYNPASVALWDENCGRFACRHRLILSAGDSDSLEFYREGNEVIALSLNTRLGYCGIQVYDETMGEQIGELFVQTDYEIADILGRKGVDLAPMTIAKRLYAHFWEVYC
jgi:hypothetical protein